MPAGRGIKGIDREWAEQLLLFIAEPTERVFAIKKHTGPDSCRYVWIWSHTKHEQNSCRSLLLLVNTHARWDLHTLYADTHSPSPLFMHARER